MHLTSLPKAETVRSRSKTKSRHRQIKNSTYQRATNSTACRRKQSDKLDPFVQSRPGPDNWYLEFQTQTGFSNPDQKQIRPGKNRTWTRSNYSDRKKKQNPDWTSDRAIDRSNDRATERPSDRSTDRPSDRATDRLSHRATERPSDRLWL